MGSVRKLLSFAVATALLGLAACNDESYLPRNSRHYVPISNEMQGLMAEKGMRTHAPIMIRAFKKESELEVWKMASSGRYELLKTFPMCRWSGQLGPKVREGDRQVPEGFYAITPQAMNPNSNFYLSFNVGYPNEFDRSFGRTGSLIMVHGDCSSMGCFAMTDRQIADIYALTREAFAGGQRQIQLQSMPFRMTAENIAKFRNDAHMPFWRNLKQGNDHFEVTRREPQVTVSGGRYCFNGGCGGERDEAAHQAVAEKNRSDEMKVAQLVSQGTRAVKRIYRDGDQHPVFKRTMIAETGEARSVGPTRNGVSREEALAQGPIEIAVEEYSSHRARGRTATQIADLAIQQRMQQDTEAAGGVSTPRPAAAPAATAVATAAPAGRAQQAGRPVVPAAQPAAAAAPALAVAPAGLPTPDARGLFDRMMGTVGLGGGSAPAEDGALQEHAPAPVNTPLPPRRQANAPSGQRTSDLVSSGERLIPAQMTGFSAPRQ
jgi:murein L,D-transpeptidase YafK